MKKFCILVFTIFCFSMLCVQSLSVSAYTQEEKQMVKDWLAAHGYSPDWGGAEQAYQDYLDGKIDVSGYGIPPSTAQTEEQTETEPETISPKKKKQKQDSKSQSEDSKEGIESGSEQDLGLSGGRTSAEESLDPVQEETASESEKTKKDPEGVSKEETEKAGSRKSKAASQQTEEEKSDAKLETTRNAEKSDRKGTEISVIQLLSALVVLLLAALAGSLIYALKSRK